MTELTLVTVHYNTPEITIRCLESLLQHLPEELDYQLVVVDNASEAGAYDAIRNFVHSAQTDRLHLLRSRINTGFGWGNMMGIQDFPARYYLFINNDTSVDRDVFSPCIAFLESHPDAAVCGIQIVDSDGAPQISFDHFASPWRELLGSSLLERLTVKPKRRDVFSEPIPVDYVNGSFMFVRGVDFERIGGFDPHIFLYYEESDLCLRLRRKGRQTWFLPGLKYTHIQNASVRKTATGATKKIELKRSFLYVTRKHYGLPAFLAIWVWLLLRYGLTSLLRPRYFSLFMYLLRGAPLHQTLRLAQPIVNTAGRG